MKKLALLLTCIFCLNYAAEETETLNPAITNADDTTCQVTTDNVELRISDMQTQVPVLMGYFMSSLSKGLGSGVATGLVRSTFETTDKPYDLFLHTMALSSELWNNCDKEQEALRCAEIADRLNTHIYAQRFIYINANLDEHLQHPLGHLEEFQPEQFEVKNRAYSVAATLAGFAIGAYLGNKLGNGMYNGCAWLWNWYYPQAPAFGDNYIDLAHIQPKQ